LTFGSVFSAYASYLTWNSAKAKDVELFDWCFFGWMMFIAALYAVSFGKIAKKSPYSWVYWSIAITEFFMNGFMAVMI